MKTNALASGAIAVILAAASVPAAIAQPYNDGSYARSAGDYEYQRDVYAREQADYAERQAQYQRDYNAYMRAQRDYDRRYGRGAYVRRYGVFQGAAVSPNQASYDCGRRRDGNTTAGVIIGAIAGGHVRDADDPPTGEYAELARQLQVREPAEQPECRNHRVQVDSAHPGGSERDSERRQNPHLNLRHAQYSVLGRAPSRDR